MSYQPVSPIFLFLFTRRGRGFEAPTPDGGRTPSPRKKENNTLPAQKGRGLDFGALF